MPNELIPYDSKVTIFGGMSVVLGWITQTTANEVAAFVAIAGGFLAAMYNILKIVEWFDNRKHKKIKS